MTREKPLSDSQNTGHLIQYTENTTYWDATLPHVKSSAADKIATVACIFKFLTLTEYCICRVLKFLTLTEYCIGRALKFLTLTKYCISCIFKFLTLTEYCICCTVKLWTLTEYLLYIKVFNPNWVLYLL